MKKFLAILTILICLVVPAAPVAAVEVLDPVCDNISQADQPATCKDNEAQQNRSDDLLFGEGGILTIATNIFSIILGVAAVIVILISAVRLIASNGDTNTVTSSRNWILYSIIGLVVAGISQAVVIFVLTQVGG